MTFRSLSLSASALFMMVALQHDAAPSVPEGWSFSASVPEDYRAGVDHRTVHSGKGSGFIQYAVDPMVVHPKRGSADLVQIFKVGTYRGHRVRVSAFAKGESIAEGTFLYLALDGGSRSKPESIALDPVIGRGTSDWSQCECVLDVPSSMTVMAIGAVLAGRGTLWLDDVHIEVVSTTVPLKGTRGKGPPARLSELQSGEPETGPVNLDFEQE